MPHKKKLDASLRPDDVAQALGARDFRILALERQVAVLEERIDELEKDLPEPPEEEATSASLHQ